MAIYGLSDHECWFCDINPAPPYDCRVLEGKTGPRDGVMPFYPEWAAQWEPWNGTLPKVTDTVGDHAIYGERTARAFKRHKIPFTPYTLRHAWCIRASVVFKQPIPGEVYLIIEISDTTLDRDLGSKADLYAATSIPDYWVLNIAGQQLHVFREPRADGYQRQLILRAQQPITPLAFLNCTLTVQECFGM
ncbi:MAG: Uma2 family endonuclease [Synechococcales cyanobacterium T60_A2020_003]|nr:Uma2 family endonuclease [Synechococcales cyanobacterium T60_A2020_003]